MSNQTIYALSDIQHPEFPELRQLIKRGILINAWMRDVSRVRSDDVDIHGGRFYGGWFHGGEFHGGEFHGGVFHGAALSGRLLEVLSGWRGAALRRLDNPEPDLAVARGAVAYGLARRGQGLRIGGGSARGYVLLVEAGHKRRQIICRQIYRRPCVARLRSIAVRSRPYSIHYRNAALDILPDLWKQEVVLVNGVSYLLPGEWADDGDKIKLNPSYFAPYAYRIFAKYDKTNKWENLIASSYSVIKASSALSVFNLPPDWCYMDKKTGEISLTQDATNTESDYSYDAIRTHWRIAMDCILNNDNRAFDFLKSSTKFLISYWKVHKTLPGSVSPAGVVRKDADSAAIYGAVLPAIAVVDTNMATEMFYTKLSATFVKGFWANPQDYYAQNMIWFGIALWINTDRYLANPLSDRGLANLL